MSFSTRFIRRRQWKKKLSLRRPVRFVRRYPFRAFFITLGLLFGVIIIGNIVSNAGNKQAATTPQIKQVQVYQIGTLPKVTFQAKIEKSGVIQINTQTSGIVQTIDVQEGQQVSRGDTLLNLSSNYQGGNAPAIQSQIVEKQNKITQSTYQEQKNLINTQRDLANNTQSNNDQLRNLTAQSATEAAGLINQNQDILNTITDQLNTLQNNETNGAPLPTGNTQTYDQLILQSKQLQAQYQGTINQLNTQQRQLAYQADASQPFTQMQYNQRDITLKQLDIQEKTLDINKEISSLQLQLAEVNASLMYPASPCDGIVDRVYATFGQSVTPGTQLLSISCDQQSVKAVVQIPANLASAVSRVEPTLIHLDDQTISETPDYVSRDATDGTLYSVIYHLPDHAQMYITNGNYITADVPVGLQNTSAVDPYVPLDAIYQTENSAYIFVVDHGKAKSEAVQLGTVYGRFVSVNNGINNGDQIILNRNIVNGDRVTVSK